MLSNYVYKLSWIKQPKLKKISLLLKTIGTFCTIKAATKKTSNLVNEGLGLGLGCKCKQSN